jgi:predicted NACHT family NTPase
LALSNHRLVIIGDPGCGKSTFLHWVAHALAGEHLGRDSGVILRRHGVPRDIGSPPPYPVLLSIAGWREHIATVDPRNRGPALASGADWLPSCLAARAGSASQPLGVDDFRHLLSKGHAMLLPDGLDEAPDRRCRKQAVALIEALTHAYPDCRMVVSSRPAALQDDVIIAAFEQVRVDPLNAAAIDDFLARWSRALFRDRPRQGRCPPPGPGRRAGLPPGDPPACR